MNIFVCTKQVPDSRSIISPDAKGGYIETEHMLWNINPEDECAVELALQIREKDENSTITAVRVGNTEDYEALITAMAMGADGAVLVKTTESFIDPMMAAKALKGAIEYHEKHPDLILCGTQSFGDESCQVPQILAQLLGFPCVSKVMECSINGGKLAIKRQVEGGVFERYSLPMPAVIACNYRINTPRYAPFPRIKAARQKPITELSLNDVGLDDNDLRLRYTNYRFTHEKNPGKVFDATDKAEIEDVVKELLRTLSSDLTLFSKKQF